MVVWSASVSVLCRTRDRIVRDNLIIRPIATTVIESYRTRNISSRYLTVRSCTVDIFGPTVKLIGGLLTGVASILKAMTIPNIYLEPIGIEPIGR